MNLKLNLTYNIYKFPSAIYSQHFYLHLSNIIGSTVTTGPCLTNTTTFSRPFQGLKKPLLPADPLGEQVSHFAAMGHFLLIFVNDFDFWTSKF